MSDCGPETPAPEEFLGTPVLTPPAPGGTSLVTLADTLPPILTKNRECDAVTALKRGLAEYLEQAYIDVLGARIRFYQVFYNHAEPEDLAKYPAALISTEGEAEYDYHGMTPVLDPKRLVIDPTEPGDERTFLVKYAEVTVNLMIEVFTSSPEERSQIAMMLEDVLNPVDWMYGFKLDLPHYFNQRAVFAPVQSQFLDTEDDARQRKRPATVTLSGQISLLRVRSLPTLDPRAEIVVDSPNP